LLNNHRLRVKRAERPENGTILPVREHAMMPDLRWGLVGSNSRKAPIESKVNMGQETNLKKQSGIKKDISKAYNEYKEFEGKQYTGMNVGKGHKWYYDRGEWKEKKITPDKWELLSMSIREDLARPQKAQAFLLEQNITGIS
jgi:hypothetical protein